MLIVKFLKIDFIIFIAVLGSQENILEGTEIFQIFSLGDFEEGKSHNWISFLLYITVEMN